MSLKCSLFGHSYGETEVEREREQEGEELVSTVREVKRCHRCGKRLVISENTEVTTVEASHGSEEHPASAGVGEQQHGERAGEPAEAEVSGGSATDTGVDGRGEEIPDAEWGVDTGDQHEAEFEPQREDDAVILDDDGEEVDPAEWDDDDGTDELGDWEPDIDPDPPGREPEPTDVPTAGLTVPEGEFRCPECGFAAAVEGSSLRAGDFCPECHVGVLEHRPE